MEMIKPIMFTLLISFCNGQSTTQCGECECISVGSDYILDCEGLGIHKLPEIDSIIERSISYAYFKDNKITFLNKTILSRWYSLQYIDFSGNYNLPCTELVKIDISIKIGSTKDCVSTTEGMYLHVKFICL